MEKLLYINIDFKKYQNKAMGQIRAFDNLKIKSDVVTMENENGNCFFKAYEYKKKKLVLKYKKCLTEAFEIKQGNNSFKALFTRLIKTIKINNLFKKEVLKYYKERSFDYCYIRRIGFFVIFLRSMFKTISKKTKIIYEIPTYPLDKYDSVLVNFSQKIEMCVFNLCIKKYVSLIPIMLQNDCKLDKKMICISNAVDFAKYEDININKPKLSKKFNIVIIAHILSWHGYDRLIKSISKYNGKYKIEVDIFSDLSGETLNLKELSEKLNITLNVHFKGQKPMEEILKNIDKYHIAVGALGYHRRNGKYDTSIKNKEYCAMGLPCICSTKDLAFNEDFKYIYKVPSDDSDFDLEKIIDWYKEINKEDYKNKMREYAKKELGFEKNYKKVFDRLR